MCGCDSSVFLSVYLSIYGVQNKLENLFEMNMNESNDSKKDVDSVNILTNSVKSKIVRVLC